VLEGEEAAGPAESRLDFVDDEENVMAIAEPPEGGQELGRRV
jgi:hypothetical protein